MVDSDGGLSIRLCQYSWYIAMLSVNHWHCLFSSFECIDSDSLQFKAKSISMESEILSS